MVAAVAMPSSFVLSVALILPAAEVVAAVMLMAGVVVPVETIGAVPVTPVTLPEDGVVHAITDPFEASTWPVVPTVVRPVPPLASASVPAMVSVPLVVTGPPLKLNPVVPPEAAILVTVPLEAVMVAHEGLEPLVVRYLPEFDV